MNDTNRKTTGRLAGCTAANGLSLAATPVFAIMALLTATIDGNHSGAHAAAWPLNGMSMMYLLMSIFHAPPWLKLVSVAALRGKSS